MRIYGKFNSIFSFLLIITIVIGTYTVCADYTQISDNENLDILTGLGIMNIERSSTYDADQYMSRQEFIGALGRLFNYPTTENEQIFDDVPVAIENSGYINTAYNLGIIVGYDNKQFRPYDTIAYLDAIKCILYAAGYDKYIKAVDDTGFVKSLQLSGLDKGLDYNSSQLMRRREIADLLVNALDVPVMLPNAVTLSSSTNFVHTNLSKTSTVMTEHLKVSIIKGLVSANHYTNIYNTLGTHLSKHQIIIDGIKCEYDDEIDFLGQYVTAYLKHEDDTDIYKVLYISSSQRNWTTTLAYDSFSYSNGKIIYFPDDGKEIKYSLSDGAAVIYNGKFIGSVGTDYIDKSSFDIKSGFATLIDNDDDDMIDVVKLVEYDNVYVTRVNLDEKSVFDGNTGKVIKFDDLDCEYSFIYNNRETVMGKITTENVLTIAKSRDGKLCTIYISDKYITGTITELSDNTVIIDGDEYTISSQYIALSNIDKEKKLDVRTCGTFYLNIENEIAAFKSGRTDNYGYIVSSLYDDNGVNKKAKIKLYTQDGELVIYDLAEKVLFIDGETENRVDAGEVISNLSNYEVIKFRVNDEKLISIVEKSSYDSNYSKNIFNKNTEKSDLEYHLGVLGAQYCVDGNTIVFNVPDPDCGLDVKDINNYSTGANFRGDYRYTVDIYDMNEFRSAKVVVNYCTSPSSILYTGYSHPLVVAKTSLKNVDNEMIYTILGYQQNSENIIRVEDRNITEDTSVSSAAPWVIGDFKIGDVKFGDIIQYNLNGNRFLSKFRVLFRPGVDTDYFEKWTNSGEITYSSLRAHMYTAFSEIKAINNVGQFVYVTPEGSEKVATLNNQTNKYIVDMKAKTVSSAIQQDIMVGDKVFVMITYDRVYAMFIYRW